MVAMLEYETEFKNLKGPPTRVDLNCISTSYPFTKADEVADE